MVQVLDSCSSVWRALQTWAPSDGPMVSVITLYKSRRRQHGVQPPYFSASNTPNCFSPESEEALLLGLGHIWNARHSTVFKIRLDHCQEEWSSSLPGQLSWWSLQCPDLAGSLWCTALTSTMSGYYCQWKLLEFLYKQCTSSLPLFQRNTNKQTLLDHLTEEGHCCPKLFQLTIVCLLVLRWKRGRELVHCLYKNSRHVYQPPVGPQNLTW